MKKTLIALLISFGALGAVAACDANEGPMEEAGEEIDDAVDEIDDATN